MNTITKSPRIGDIIAFDNGTKKVIFLRLSDYDGAPDGHTVVGVVGARHGNQVLAVHKTSANAKYADIYDYIVTGYNLDGESHDVTIRLHGKPTTSSYYTFTYAAETKAAFAAAFNDWLQATDANGGDADRRMYVCYMDDSENVILRRENYAAAEYIGSSMTYIGSGLTLAAIAATEVPALAQTDHFNGAASADGAIINMNRALLYFKSDNSSTIYNPNTDITTTKRNYPVCLPAYLGTSAYQSDHCAYLRSVYGAGEAGWRKQMEDCRLFSPSQRGAQGGQFRNAKAFTKALGEVIYQTMIGTPTTKAKYPAANYCLQAGYVGVKGAERGDWFLGNIDDIAEIWKNQTYPAIYSGGVQVNVSATDADPINAGLNKIGGTLLGNNLYAWSCVRAYASSAFNYYGNYGFCYNSYFCISFRAVPLALIEIEP